ncbi:MAG: hypothetical protein V3R59_01865 [Gammaproteobacteria bacterium]
MAENTQEPEIQMETDSLYREETITDRRVGSLQKLTPIKPDGTPDDAREDVYVGQTQIFTPAGALPLSFEVEASSLEEAIAKFGDSAKTALAEAMERLEALRRQSASSIIVPGSGTDGHGGMPLR